VTRLLLGEMGRHGEAVSEVNGRPVYVVYGLPGETVEAEISGSHAQLREILDPSPERIDPFCPHFGQCGGCQIQHWQMESYRQWKRDLIVTALKNQGVAAVVSGAGPTVLVLARAVGSGTDADEAISAAFGGAMGGWRILPLAVDRAGATVEPSTR